VQPKKQFHTLLALLKDENIELVIAGRILDKAYAEEIRQLAYQANVSDRVRLLGAVSDSDKAWYYRNCKAFAFPSTSAGSGAPLMEAMKYGKPVFLSDGSGLSEIGAEECFYFESFEPDEMYQTYREGLQNFQRLNMATRMMSRARLYSWEDKAAEYVQLYRSLFQ
jgi:glycosyltransferase involved in cell wall biosynthesis